MEINIQRFKGEFEQISRFGALAGGGLTRLAFSREDKEAPISSYRYFKKKISRSKSTMRVIFSLNLEALKIPICRP